MDGDPIRGSALGVAGRLRRVVDWGQKFAPAVVTAELGCGARAVASELGREAGQRSRGLPNIDDPGRGAGGREGSRFRAPAFCRRGLRRRLHTVATGGGKGQISAGEGSKLAATGARAGGGGAPVRDFLHGIGRLRGCAGKGGGWTIHEGREGAQRGRVFGSARLVGKGRNWRRWEGAARRNATCGVRLTGGADGVVRGVKGSREGAKGGREVAQTVHMAMRKGKFATKSVQIGREMGEGQWAVVGGQRPVFGGREGSRERQGPVAGCQGPDVGGGAGAGRWCEARRLGCVGR